MERGWLYGKALLEHVHKLSGGKVALHFSGGKDSLAAWIVLRQAGFEVVPISFYVVPKLSFVEDYLTYLESHFGQVIVRLPYPDTYTSPNNAVLQWMSSFWSWGKLGLPKEVTIHEIRRWWLRSVSKDENMWHATGFKLTDSFVRRLSMLRNGPLYPETRRCDVVWDMSKGDVLDTIRKEGVKLAPEYTWMGRSWEFGSPNAMAHIRQHLPDDFAKLKAVYPLLDAVVARRAYVAETHAKQEAWANMSEADEDEAGRA